MWIIQAKNIIIRIDNRTKAKKIVKNLSDLTIRPITIEF